MSVFVSPRSQSQHADDIIVSIWTSMREPFVVPMEYHEKHKHVYEIFDDDKAGCLVCGSVHICNQCEDVVETEESCVCNITGLVTYPYIFKATEFTDTCTIPKRNRRHNCIEQTQQHVQVCQNINEHVEMFFTSTLAKSVLLKEQQYSLKTLLQVIMTQVAEFHDDSTAAHRTMPFNVIGQICQCLQPGMVFKYKTYANNVLDFVSHVFDDEHRRHVLELACTTLSNFLTPLHSSEILRIRPSEVSSLMIGLLYLLRHGVYVHGLVILPQISDLRLILPNTMHLERVYKVKAKTLTEVENRVKFTLRQMDPVSIKSMWNL